MLNRLQNLFTLGSLTDALSAKLAILECVAASGSSIIASATFLSDLFKLSSSLLIIVSKF